MTRVKIQRRPSGIIKGDTFILPTGEEVWTAISDAELRGRDVWIEVQYAVDGGRQLRVWDADDTEFTLTILRPGDK